MQDKVALFCLLSWPCYVLLALSHRALPPSSTYERMGIVQPGPPHMTGDKDQEMCECMCDMAVCPRAV